MRLGFSCWLTGDPIHYILQVSLISPNRFNILNIGGIHDFSLVEKSECKLDSNNFEASWNYFIANHSFSLEFTIMLNYK